MKYKAEPYQLEGIRFLCEHSQAGLFADPGTGKTGMTLAAFTALKKAGRVNRALVIAPRLVCHNVWPCEVSKFEQFKHLKTVLFHGEGKDKNVIHEFVEPKADLVLTSPESLRWLLELLPLRWFTRQKNRLTWPWDVLIVDESSKFKNHKAVRNKSIQPYLGLFSTRWILTGTPTPHSLIDLWAQMYLIDLGNTLGKNITTFRRQYCQLKNPKHWTYELLPGADKTIHDRVSPYVIRFDETLFKLPERVVNDVKVKLHDRARKIYDSMQKQFFAELDGETVFAPKNSSKYLLCRQIANGRMYDPGGVQFDGDQRVDRGKKVYKIHSEKLEALDNILDELQGKPALVAYYFRHDLNALTSHLERRYPRIGSCPYIGAGVDVKTANKHLEQWNKGKLPVLVVHPASLAHGLNLQAGGNDLIFYSLTDVLEDYQQLIKRLHRRGVNGQVRIHRIIAKNTIDEGVIDGLNSKAQTQNALLEAVKAYRASCIVGTGKPIMGGLQLPKKGLANG